MSIAFDAYIAKKRGLSYGQYMALTDEAVALYQNSRAERGLNESKERERLRKQYKKEFDKAHLRAKKKR